MDIIFNPTKEYSKSKKLFFILKKFDKKLDYIEIQDGFLFVKQEENPNLEIYNLKADFNLEGSLPFFPANIIKVDLERGYIFLGYWNELIARYELRGYLLDQIKTKNENNSFFENKSFIRDLNHVEFCKNKTYLIDESGRIYNSEMSFDLNFRANYLAKFDLSKFGIKKQSHNYKIVFIKGENNILKFIEDVSLKFKEEDDLGDGISLKTFSIKASAFRSNDKNQAVPIFIVHNNNNLYVCYLNGNLLELFSRRCSEVKLSCSKQYLIINDEIDQDESNFYVYDLSNKLLRPIYNLCLDEKAIAFGLNKSENSLIIVLDSYEVRSYSLKSTDGCLIL